MEKPWLALPISILIVLISLAFGRRLLALLKVKADTAVESSVFGLGLGLGVLAYLVLAVGLAGCLYAWVLATIIAAVGLLSVRQIGEVLRDIVGGLRSRAGVKLGAAGALIGGSVVMLGAFALISALAPPACWDWDGLAYHLAVPKMYLAQHAIFYVPFMSHSNFPFLTEMLYTIGLSFGSVGVAKLFHFTMYLASAVAIYSLGRRHVGRVAGSVGALLFMSVPVIAWEAGLAYADITTALYISLAVYAVLNWEQTGSRPWLAVCGIMGGFALGTKVLAAVPIAALCFWIIVSSWRSHKWGRGLGLAVLVGAVALLVGSPWYIKSYLYTGNPVYPFLYDVFGGRYWSQEAAESYRGAQLAFGMGRGTADFLLVPWNLTMNGFRFFDTSGALGLIGMAFVGLIPLHAFIGGANKAIVKIGLVLAVFLAAWFVLMQQSRYLIGVLPLACVMAASAVDAANARWGAGRHAVNGFVALCVILCMVPSFLLAAVGATVVAGMDSTDEYLSEILEIYDAEAYINDFLPADARIVLFDEARGFYLDREYIWGNPGHHEMTPWSSFRRGADMVAYFKGRGYTHALINWRFAQPDSVHQELIAEAIADGVMEEIYASNGVSVYEFAEE